MTVRALGRALLIGPADVASSVAKDGKAAVSGGV